MGSFDGNSAGFIASTPCKEQKMRRKEIPLLCASALALLVFLGSTHASAAAPLPAGLSKNLSPLSSVEQIVLPPVDTAQLAVEDADRERIGLAPRFAVPFAVSQTPRNAGSWETLKSGERIWRLRVLSAGASSLNFGFGRYLMPAGGKLFVYGPDGSSVRGPFTDEDNEVHGEFWTPVVLGPEAVIELSVPEEMLPYLKLELTAVNHGYKEFWVSGPDKSGSCNVDVICPEGDGWRDEIRSVAVISTGGSTFCSGFLVNNTDNDNTPYFMTAYHCGITAANAASLVVYWNYETSTCGGTPDGTLNEYQSGSYFRAARSGSDFTLVELDDAPAEAFNVHWAGWDNSDANPSSATGIHHPGTDEKRISFENDPLSTTSYLGTASPGDSTHLRVFDWDVGTTEGGSSGSGLWNQDHRIVGQLHGGYAACGNDSSDWYGRFSVSWNTGTTAATRLRDWLDPGSTGAVFLDGIDQCSRPTVDFTANPNPAPVGEPVEFTSSVSGGTPPYEYAWDMDADGITDCTTADCTHVYAEPFSGSVVLTVTDSYPCPASRVHHLAVGCSDEDGDGYGAMASALCTHPEEDCDDSDPAVNPGAAEVCGNGVDDDCDGKADGADSDCAAPPWGSAATAEASVLGGRAPGCTGACNHLGSVLIPMGLLVLWKLRRRRK
jgi:hypothetical protein